MYAFVLGSVVVMEHTSAAPDLMWSVRSDGRASS